LEILVENKVTLNETNQETYINLSYIPDPVLDKLIKLTDHLIKQENEFDAFENEKKELINKYFS
jgi:hypothetical protein